MAEKSSDRNKDDSTNCASIKQVNKMLDVSKPVKNKMFGVQKERLEDYLPRRGQCVYRCFQCNRAFTYKWNLKRHMKLHFGGTVTLSCDVCNKMFLGFRKFTEHMNTHIGEKPFSCNICKEVFSRSYLLREHLINHISYVPE